MFTLQSSLLTRMYPITVRHINPGVITGEERVITLHSGTYGFFHNKNARYQPAAAGALGGGRSAEAEAAAGRALNITAAAAATLYCFDGTGRELGVAPATASGTHGGWLVTVPANGACVLERSAGVGGE